MAGITFWELLLPALCSVYRRSCSRDLNRVELQYNGHNDPLPPAEQIAIPLAATTGLFDDLPPDKVVRASARIREPLRCELPGFDAPQVSRGKLGDAEREPLLAVDERPSLLLKWKPSKD